MTITADQFYDLSYAAFAMALCYAQLDILLKDGSKYVRLSPILWSVMSGWGLLSILMFMHLQYWFAAVGVLATCAGNLALGLKALTQPNPAADGEKRQCLQGFATHPIPAYENYSYWNTTDGYVYTYVQNEWLKGPRI